jgi:putative DNA primase/helicase
MIHLFTKWTAPATCAKGYKLDGDELIKVQAITPFVAQAERVSVSDIKALEAVVRACSLGNFLTTGVSGGDSVQVGVRRLKDLFLHPVGPGILVIDGDDLEAFGIATAADLVGKLREIEPALSNVGFVASPSASSFLQWPGGSHGLRGLHLFALIDDARQVPGVLDALHAKCLAVGLARGKVSARGVVLVRSLVDIAMRTSNQPCFEGGARLISDGLVQPRGIEMFPGGVLIASTIAAPDAATISAKKVTEAKIKKALTKDAEAQAAAWSGARVRELVGNGIDEDAARKLVITLSKTIGAKIDLPEEWMIHLDDGRNVTVGKIMAARDQFDGLTCRDPLEPDTGQCKAMIFCGIDQDKPMIHSYARGSEARYFLKVIKDFPPFTDFTEPLGNIVNTELSDTEAGEEKLHPTSPASPAHRRSIGRGDLLTYDDKGAAHRLVASHARNRLKPFLTDCFAWSAPAQTWHEWSLTHWAACETAAGFDKALHDMVDVGCSTLGFTPSYTKGITDLLKTGASLPLPELNGARLLPFVNGLLDIRNKRITPAIPSRALTWCIPHRYDDTASCPNTRAWLADAVGNDGSMVEYLRAWLAAILLGRSDLQRFLYLKGPGGTGKSTFIRLAEALVGKHAVFVTDLRNLEQNRFETAAIYGKRIVIITDASRYGGSVEVLKALTGQDPLRIERKHQQQSGTFIFDGIVILASNDDLVTTDLTSGIDRRRAVVNFDRVVSEQEKATWQARGGEETILHGELPGLVNWLLHMPAAELEDIIRNPPAQAAQSNHIAMLANNPVARWMVDNCVPGTDTTIVGQKKEVRTLSGTTEYSDSDVHLYPAYLAWCAAENIHQLQRQRFKSTLIDAARTLGRPVEEQRKNRDGRHGIVGLRLKSEGEATFAWFSEEKFHPVKSGEVLGEDINTPGSHAATGFMPSGEVGEVNPHTCSDATRTDRVEELV